MGIVGVYARPVFWALCLSLAGLAGAAHADKPIYAARHGVAAGGYDVVAYFLEGQPVMGELRHRVMWKGAIWLFSSSANRETFEMDPRAYAPRYGGYCSYAMSKGQVKSADPLSWRIHKGRLYLTQGPEAFRLWVRDIPGHVQSANAHWPAVLSK